MNVTFLLSVQHTVTKDKTWSTLLHEVFLTVSSHKNKLFSIIFECSEQHSKLISSSVQKFNKIKNEKIELRENAIVGSMHL